MFTPLFISITTICSMMNPLEPPTAKYLGSDGKNLKESLVLREEQGGIAGTSVTEWTIEKDGKWTLAQFLVAGNGKEQDGTRQKTAGQLKPTELTKLVERLAADNMLDLPATLGTAAKINPHNYVLHFGKKKITLSGAQPRIDNNLKANVLSAVPDTDPTTADVKRLAEIVNLVVSLTAAEIKE